MKKMSISVKITVKSSFRLFRFKFVVAQKFPDLLLLCTSIVEVSANVFKTFVFRYKRKFARVVVILLACGVFDKSKKENGCIMSYFELWTVSIEIWDAQCCIEFSVECV